MAYRYDLSIDDVNHRNSVELVEIFPDDSWLNITAA